MDHTQEIGRPIRYLDLLTSTDQPKNVLLLVDPIPDIRLGRAINEKPRGRPCGPRLDRHLKEKIKVEEAV